MVVTEEPSPASSCRHSAQPWTHWTCVIVMKLHVALAASRSCNVLGLRGPRAGRGAGGNPYVTGPESPSVKRGACHCHCWGGGKGGCADGTEGKAPPGGDLWATSPVRAVLPAGKRGGWKTSPRVSPKEGEGKISLSTVIPWGLSKKVSIIKSRADGQDIY